MQEHDASSWFLAARLISALRGDAEARNRDDKFADRDKLIAHLGLVADECRNLRARVSETVVNNEIRAIKGKGSPIGTFGDIIIVADTIGAAIQAELETIVFLLISDENVHYFRDKQLFGSEVADNFPSAIRDIEEAGKCLALGRGTACVFHLMRTMELALKVLANPLGIPYAPSWEAYIRQIEKKLSEPHNKKPPEWKKEEPFYRELLGNFQTVKIAWRNPTMHIVRSYTPEEAEDVFRAVRAFMKRIATRFASAPAQADASAS
jgi:hypothetical protein